MKSKKTIDITGVPKKEIESLYQYLTVYKSAKGDNKSFQLTSKLLNTVYRKAQNLKKEGLLIITIPSDIKYNFKVKCLITRELK